MRKLNEQTKAAIRKAFHNLTGSGVPEESLARFLADSAISYLELPEAILNDWFRPDEYQDSEVCAEPKVATLTGLAVGDALGMPFEMCGVHSNILLNWKGEFRDGRASAYTQDLKAGQWTDDTKMAKALAESLRAEGTYSPAAAAKKYLDWFQSGDLRGIGTTTQQAMTRLEAGYPWTQSGIVGSEGNGSAMRMAPVGILFRDNIQAAAEMAVIDSRITHKSPEAEAGSIAVAVGVAALLQGVPREALISKVLEWMPDDRLQLAQRLRTAQGMVKQGCSERDLANNLAEFGTSAHVVQTVPTAFLAFASTTSFRDAVHVAVLAGGDTDTTAAIVGALAGTFYGIEQVATLLEHVEGAKELRALERSLYKAARPVYMVHE